MTREDIQMINQGMLSGSFSTTGTSTPLTPGKEVLYPHNTRIFKTFEEDVHSEKKACFLIKVASAVRLKVKREFEYHGAVIRIQNGDFGVIMEVV
jgi:hypothetical protein